MARQPVKLSDGTVVGWYNANKKRHYKTETPYVRPAKGSPEAKAWGQSMQQYRKTVNANTPCNPTKAGTPQKRVKDKDGKWVCRVGTGGARARATANTPCPKDNQVRVPKQVQTKTKGIVTRYECRVANPVSKEERIAKLKAAAPAAREKAAEKRLALLERGINPLTVNGCKKKRGEPYKIPVATGKKTIQRVGTRAFEIDEYRCKVAEDQQQGKLIHKATRGSSSKSSSRTTSRSSSRAPSRTQSLNLNQIAGPSTGTPCGTSGKGLPKFVYMTGKGTTKCTTVNDASRHGWKFA